LICKQSGIDELVGRQQQDMYILLLSLFVLFGEKGGKKELIMTIMGNFPVINCLKDCFS